MSDLPQPLGPQLASELATRGMDAVSSLSGSAAEEIKQWLGDEARAFRFKRMLKLFASAKQRLADAGLKLNPVRAKVLFPLIEAASLEEDEGQEAEEMHERWGSLLANASSHPEKVPPAFPAVLKELSAADAQLFDLLLGLHYTQPDGKFSLLEIARAVIANEKEGATHPKTYLSLGNLERLALIQRVPELGLDQLHLDPATAQTRPVRTLGDYLSTVPKSAIIFHHQVTEFGIEFNEACRPPLKAQE